MNVSAPGSPRPPGPHSKSISGQCTAILGSPGSAPSAISSMLGWVAAVNATESPSQLRPPLIHRTWMSVSGLFITVTMSCDLPESLLGQLPQHVIERRLRLLDPMHRGGRDHEEV